MSGRRGSCLGNDLNPCALRHPPVEHRHVVVVGAKVAERRRAVGHGVDDVAVLPQAALEDRPQRRIVLGHQNSHCRGRIDV